MHRLSSRGSLNMKIVVAGALASLLLNSPSLRGWQNDIPTVTKDRAVEISGSGTAIARVVLPRGFYTIQMTVRGNVDRSFGTAIEDNFIVQIEAIEGTASMPGILANEIASSWTGSTTLRVDGGFLDLLAHPEGKQVVSVDASGSWTLKFTME